MEWIFVLWLIVVAGLVLLAVRRGEASTGGDRDPWLTRPSYSPAVQSLARAIATAEGFYRAGSAPARAHNPGAIKVPGWTGPTTGTQGISVFGSDAEGWAALHRQLQLIVDGDSGVYSLSMTIDGMAQRWTSTDAGPWAAIVAGQLGVSRQTRLSGVLT